MSVSAAHAWVEVYFPEYGWVEFDPTGGGLAQAEPLPTGEPVPTAAPGSSASGGLGAVLPPFSRDIGHATSGDGTPVVSRQPNVGLIVVALVLLIAVGTLAFIVWRRGPRGEVTPDRAYATLTRLAGRLGFGPRPTQTVYEYAGALSEMLPQSRPEIQTVAQAKVEVAYGRQMLGEDRMVALREAHRRLRVGLLRLMFRRTPRRRSALEGAGLLPFLTDLLRALGQGSARGVR